MTKVNRETTAFMTLVLGLVFLFVFSQSPDAYSEEGKKPKEPETPAAKEMPKKDEGPSLREKDHDAASG